MSHRTSTPSSRTFPTASPHRRPWLRRLVVAGVGALVLAGAPAIAMACPDPGSGPPEHDRTATTVWVNNCPLTRIGDHLVRCDQLTGAGATAMLWLPEQRPAEPPIA